MVALGLKGSETHLLYPDQAQSSICEKCLMSIWEQTPKMDREPYSPFPEL